MRLKINSVKPAHGSKLKEETMYRECERCSRSIPIDRLTALPETRTCVRCSREPPKTTNDVDIDVPDASECLKQMSNQGD